MKTNRLVFVFIFFCSLLLGGLLFVVSQKSRSVEHRIRTVDNSVENEKESLRVLNAEWHYLNRPDRLEKVLLEKNGQLKNKLNAPRIGSMNALVKEGGSVTIPRPMSKPVSFKTPSAKKPEALKPSPKQVKPTEKTNFQSLLGDLEAKNGGE